MELILNISVGEAAESRPGRVATATRARPDLGSKLRGRRKMIGRSADPAGGAPARLPSLGRKRIGGQSPFRL